MDFALTADQRELTEAAADFARRELNQNLAKRDDAGEFPRDAWRACAQFGVQGLPVPVELGGSVADVLTAALVMEALGLRVPGRKPRPARWTAPVSPGGLRRPGAAEPRAGGRYRYLTEGAQVENVIERFGIIVGEADLLPRNFASVNTMCAYLRTRQPGRQEAAHE